MSKHLLKRKAFEDISNLPIHPTKPSCEKSNCSAFDLLPVLSNTKCDDTEVNVDCTRNYQNVHPFLGWYKYDLQTKHMSYD